MRLPFLFLFSCFTACKKQLKTEPVIPSEASSVQTAERIQHRLPIEISLTCEDPPCDDDVESYRFSIDAKMYIDKVSRENCEKSAEEMNLTVMDCLFRSFCMGGASDVKHLPNSPLITNPPDARISGGFDIVFQCRQGQSIPISGDIVAKETVPGMEMVVQARSFPSRIKNEVDSNGRFAVVLGGRPHPIFEPLVRPFGKRENPNIWLKTDAVVDCMAGQQTEPFLPLISLRFESTDFPTQKVWFTHRKETRVIWGKQKGLFSLLWSLPPIPQP